MTSETDVDFAPVAPTYSGRIPYFPKFFPEVAKRTNLDHESFVLDLACGTGELAFGLAPYCGEVLGVDKSAEMLSQRSVPANVRFLQADLNSGPAAIERPASLVTIGRAIPYLDRNVVMPFLGSVVSERGMVLVCAAGVTKDTPWFERYRTLCNRYRTRERASGFNGQEFFSNSEWRSTDMIHVNGFFRWRPERIHRIALSHSALAEGILKDQERFAQDLKHILAPHQDAGGFVTFEAVSWSVAYQRQRQSAAGVTTT